MNCSLASAERSLVVSLDLQPAVLRLIPESDRLVARAAFLLRMANLLSIPVVQSEQNPNGLGRTDSRLEEHLQAAAKIEKTTFGADGCPAFMQALRSSGRTQVIVAGIETHICVTQTVAGLAAAGFEPFVCVDAVGSRTPDRHEAGLERLRAAGVNLAHSEAIAYEWLGSSTHPLFRGALRIVKETTA